MSSWIPIGPAPIIEGQAEGIKSADGDNPVSGSIADIAPLVGNPDVIYVAAASGGVWKTKNATAPKPHWVPFYTYDLFTAGTLGRGVWALKNLIRPGVERNFNLFCTRNRLRTCRGCQ